MPTFTADDLVNLTKYTIYPKLMVDGVASPPFSANTLPPIAKFTGNASHRRFRERYLTPRATIAEKVLRWSGMESPSLRNGTTGRRSSRKYSVGTVAQGPDDLEEDAGGGGEQTEYLRIMPERLAMMTKAAAQSSGKKKDKPAFQHTCSRCARFGKCPSNWIPHGPCIVLIVCPS